MENLRRRHDQRLYRGRLAIPEKADSMLPGISVVRPAPGPAEPLEADDQTKESKDG